MNISTEVIEFPFVNTFTISRESRIVQKIVRCKILQNDAEGIGECTPYKHYGESCESVITQIQSLNNLQFDREKLKDLLPAGAARNAVDSALWRLENKGRLPREKFNLKHNYVTAMTVSIASLEEMRNKSIDLVNAGAKLLKIKLDANQVLEKVKAIRDACPNVDLILDANESWQILDLEVLLSALSNLNIKMIEQPLPAQNDDILSKFNHPIDICADESFHGKEHLMQLKNKYEMINIKLDKTGGLTEALEIEQLAIKNGFKIMLGCMVGSNLAMEAALPIANHAEIIDLDGGFLIKADYTDLIQYKDGQIVLS